MGFRQMRPEGGGGAAVRRAGLQLHVPRPGRRLQRPRRRLQEAVRLVRRRRRDGPRLPHRGRGRRGRALRQLGRRGDGRPIRGPRPEKVSARFLSPPPTRGLNKELRRNPVLVCTRHTRYGPTLTQEMGFSSAICLSIGSSKNFAIDTSSDSPLRLRVLTMNSRAK